MRWSDWRPVRRGWVCRSVVLVLFVAVWHASAGAAEVTYVGPSGGSWNVADHWNPVGIPDGSDTAVVSTRSVKLTTTAPGVAGLTVRNGGLVDTNGFRLLVRNAGNDAATVVTDGFLLVGGGAAGDDFDTDRLSLLGSSLMLLTDASTKVELDDGGSVAGGASIDGRGTLKLGGTLTIDGTLSASDGALLGAAGGNLFVTGDPAGAVGTGRLDPDGGGGGSITVTEPGSTLTLDVPLIDSVFAGTMTIGDTGTVVFTSQIPTWGVAGGGSRGRLELQGGNALTRAAILSAPNTATSLAGDLTVSGYGTVISDVSILPSATIALSNAADRLSLVGDTRFENVGAASLNMGPGTLATDGSVATTGTNHIVVGTFDLDGSNGNTVITVGPDAEFLAPSLQLDVEALNASGSANHFEGTLKLQDSQLEMNLDGGTAAWRLASEAGGPAVIELIDSDPSPAAGPELRGSPLTLGAAGVLRVVSQCSPCGAEGSIRTAVHFEEGTVELLDSTLRIEGPAEFDGRTVFTQTEPGKLIGLRLDSVTMADPHQVRGNQTFDVGVELSAGPLLLDDGATVTFAKFASLQGIGGGTHIGNALGPGGDTAAVFHGGIDIWGDVRIDTDRLDWSAVDRMDVAGDLVVDSPNTGINTLFSGDMNLLAGSVTLNFERPWRLSGSVVFSSEAATVGGQSIRITPAGQLLGMGTVAADVVNRGRIGPASDSPLSVGTLNITGDLTLRDAGTVEFRVQRSELLGTSHSSIAVDGAIAVDGSLELVTLGEFVPGDSFDILSAGGDITGRFASEDLPSLVDGWFWYVHYRPHLVSLEVFVLGDMDGDGDVDFDDIASFVLGLNDPDAYEDRYGVPPSARGDTDGDGDLDFDDIEELVALLRASSAESVPEPATLALFAVAAATLLRSGGRRRDRKQGVLACRAWQRAG